MPLGCQWPPVGHLPMGGSAMGGGEQEAGVRGSWPALWERRWRWEALRWVVTTSLPVMDARPPPHGAGAVSLSCATPASHVWVWGGAQGWNRRIQAVRRCVVKGEALWLGNSVQWVDGMLLWTRRQAGSPGETARTRV